MNISYNWLKSYLNVNIDPAEISSILTSIGLEVGSVDHTQSVKGGLKGLVIGHVLTCIKHPNADKLSVTTVDVGCVVLSIVCGAPNVAAGQKVVVATVGTILYKGDESLEIKKAKIKGEVSEGMICAEDEIGLGTSHDGIIVLPTDTPIGQLASDYFGIEEDVIFEVDITPNRIDSASHFGVARDLAAYFKQHGANYNATKPSIDAFAIQSNSDAIQVMVENTDSCIRYSGLTITDIDVKDSPDWLKNRLRAIGLSPINNVVDVTNFVLHELGQPLHAFDAEKISGGKVIVKTLPQNTTFVTLDEKERKLHADDLMICNAIEGMCIAGVFGGAKSGVTKNTSRIFLESACFNPVSVRKTSKRHLLNTDASFRFERGTDPEITVYALKRAALLIQKVAGGKVSSSITDIYPNPIIAKEVEVSFANVKRLIGKEIEAKTIVSILESLDIIVSNLTESSLVARIPQYRVDVTREVDIIEEILRIYGFNNVEIPNAVNSTLVYSQKPDNHKLKNLVAGQLIGAGYHEIMSNSLTRQGYYDQLTSYPADNCVALVNPLSSDLNVMRQTLLFGGLESIQHNRNRKNSDLKLFEFGNSYYFKPSGDKSPLKSYSETHELALFLTGNQSALGWDSPVKAVSFYSIKAQVVNLLSRLGLDESILVEDETDLDIFSGGLKLTVNKIVVAELGQLSKPLMKAFDLDQPVFYAQINWDNALKIAVSHKISFNELPKYPEVKRDLALLINKEVTFVQLKNLAFQTEKGLLRRVNLFDVYEGEKLGHDKKSYALSFALRDDNKTLTDVEIDKIMNKLISTYQRNFEAQIR